MSNESPQLDLLCFPFGPEVITLCSCSTQLSMNFLVLINVKMPTIVGIFNNYEQEK